MITSATSLPISSTGSLARFVPPSNGFSSYAPQDSFVKRYVDNVKANFHEDGVGGTLLAAGIHGFIGGILGSIGGALLGSVLPAPIGPALQVTCQVSGALGGFLHRLGEHDE